MLKLTHSFYRFLPHKYEIINYKISHVKTFSHLNIKGKTCTSVISQSTSFKPFIHNSLQWRHLAKIGKRFEIKKLFSKSNAEKRVEQMSESFQPTLSHVSYGGQFKVTSNDSVTSSTQLEDAGPVESLNRVNDSKRKLKDIRMWESVQKWTNPVDSAGFKFKILSYNVLAQYLLECHQYLYAQCLPQDLRWEVRAARLYDEIVNLDPDIICLQEVQSTHFLDFYSKFEDIGYTGVFKQKTGFQQDGCAIYYKRSLFNLEDQISVEYHQPDLPLLNRDNVGMAVRLRPRPEVSPAAAVASPIVVATTHLLYNPKRTDVRLAQIQLFLAEIDRFAYCCGVTNTGHYPIILTGDFNSLPDSAVIKLLSKGRVSAPQFRDDSDWRQIGVTDNCQHLAVYLNRLKGLETPENMLRIFHTDHLHSRNRFQEFQFGEEQEMNDAFVRHRELFNTGNLCHSLPLSSVYRQKKPDGSSEATTFQNYWVTVDYIYFTRCSSLKLLKRLRLPTESECISMGPLPNCFNPSDHFALAAIFELKPPSAHL